MKVNILIIIWVIIGWFAFVMPSSAYSAEKKKTAISSGMPIYRPPLRGAPIGRVGGGTRGAESGMPVLAALVPEHAGLTFQEQPCLYWYISKSSDRFAEFSLIDDESIQPLLEKQIGPPVAAGVHRMKLSENQVHLSKGKKYKWFVALVPDPNHRSQDIIAGGIIELVEIPKMLRSKLAQAEKSEVPHIYAEAGIWYDALSAISELIDASPNDPVLLKKRSSLLEQVGLSQVAEQ